MQLKNEASGYAAKTRVKAKRSTECNAYSELDQESNEEELLAYYNLTADQRKQSSWLNEGWEA